MSMPFARAVRRMFFPAALLLGGYTAFADEAVLVSATAPGYRPGTIIDENQSLSLPAGTNATLLFRSGQMLTLRGPFNGALGTLPAADSGTGVVALAHELRLQGIDASVVGGTRAIAPSATRAMLGQNVIVYPERTSTYCVGKSDTIWLARPPDAQASIGLRRNGSMRQVSWPEGATRIEWPADVPVEDGDRFEVVDQRNAVRAIVTFHRLDPSPVSETAWTAQAVLLGCRQQAESALREVAEAVSQP